MGYFSTDEKKDTYKDLDSFLKDRGYSFGSRELGISLYWIDFLCLKRKQVARIDLIQKELEYLKALRYQYKKHSQKKHLTDYDPFKWIPKSFTHIKTQWRGHIEEISKRIKELEYHMLLEPLAKIKLAPKNLIILVWGYAFKKNRKSIDWKLMENQYYWFRENKRNTNLANIFDPNKITRKTLQRMYYKHTSEKKADSFGQRNLNDLIFYIYKKSFLEKKISTWIIIPKKNNEIKNWK